MTSPSLSWDSPPKTLLLPNDAVHVWRTSLCVSTPYLRIFEDTLTADERARAERFYFQKHRERFIVGRGLLRNILSRYLGKEPDRLRFCYNSYGKPALIEEAGAGRTLLQLVPLPRNCALRRHPRDGKSASISSIFDLMLKPRNSPSDFSRHERQLCSRALPEHLQKEGFFNCWTRKEAYIKAEGKGLAIPLSAFDVSLTPGEPAALLRSRKASARDFPLVSTSVRTCEPGYAAALAVKGHDWKLKCWQWSPM